MWRSICYNWQWVCHIAVGGILAHSSLQNCFNSATLEGFQAWMVYLRSCHWTLTRPIQNLHFFLSYLSRRPAPSWDALLTQCRWWERAGWWTSCHHCWCRSPTPCRSLSQHWSAPSATDWYTLTVKETYHRSDCMKSTAPSSTTHFSSGQFYRYQYVLLFLNNN